ncbi:plasmid pRiA4b ORF-3 family protein [Nitrincola schmidtii]|uniref:plasmid pRiA4b ORF-3 family protein n=1 Tax=Nitrincola schmidtii TaxID=1730894 RepID=UPI00124E5D57|nr:plasmid pRiA4b ORF-3 family protein [Nitrincola schmidtii]
MKKIQATFLSRQLYQIHIELEESSPSVWRKLLVPSNLSLDQLHLIIQVTMGWQNCHYHVFQTQEKCCFSDPEALEDGMDSWFDETDVPLSDVLHGKSKYLSYDYDLGDAWSHRITLEKMLPLIGQQSADILCLNGENACPPEDVGGIEGYKNLITVLEDRSHPDFEEMRDWIGFDHFDPSYFNLAATNTRLQMMLTYSPLLIHDEIYDNFHSNQSEVDALISTISKKDNVQQQAIIDQFLMDMLEDDLSASGELPISPDQLHQLLYHPFDAPEVITFDPSAATLKNSPMLAIFRVLAEAAQQKGIKLTSRENLPLKVTRQMIFAIPSCLSYGQSDWNKNIRSEEDVYPVHITRILATISGLCRVQKGTLLLTAKGRKILESEQWELAFHELVKALFTEFNWAYVDSFPELGMIRATSWMTLFLLRDNDLEIPSDIAAESLLTIFPALIDDIPEEELLYTSAEMVLIHTMSHRWLTLLGLCGLIDYSKIHNPQSSKSEYSIRLSQLGKGYLGWKI